MKRVLTLVVLLGLSTTLQAGLKVAGPSGISSQTTLSGGASSASIRLQNTNSGTGSTDGALWELDTSGNVNFFHYESGRLNLFASNSLNININGTGVGLGNVVPANRLDVGGAVAVGSSYYGSITAPTNGAIIQGKVGIGTSTSSGSQLTVEHASTDTGLTINTTGTGPDVVINTIRTLQGESAVTATDNTVTIHSISSTGSGRFVAYNSGNGALVASAAFAFRNAATTSCYIQASTGTVVVEATTANVAGTTGSSPAITVSAHDNIVELENRTGDSLVFRFTIEAY